MSDLTNESDDD